MIELFVLVGLLTVAWGSVSPDRVATPARSAVRSGAVAGARSGWSGTRSAWAAGRPARSDRIAHGRSRLDRFTLPIWRRRKDADGERTGARPTAPVGRVANRVADGVQSMAGGLARVGWGGVAIGGQAARHGWTAGRSAWSDSSDMHRQRRQAGVRSGWGRIVDRAIGRSPETDPAADGESGSGEQPSAASGGENEGEHVSNDTRATSPGDPAIADADREYRGRDETRFWDGYFATRRAEREQQPPGPVDSNHASPTAPKENAMPQPAAQLDIPNITALQALATQLAAASEVATQMAGHAATTIGLPDALTFDAGRGVNEAIHALAEASPDPKALASWAELVHVLKRVVDKRVAELEILATTQVKGHTDQLTPA